MAGLITHFLCCHEALFSAELHQDLRRILSAHSDWMYLGAASPDLPYAMLLGSQSTWADTMHYTRTDELAEAAYSTIRSHWSANDKNDRIALSWLLGYVSHIVVDVTVHPVVQAVVGSYADEANRIPHRECEKTQDSLLFHDLMSGQDVTHAEYADRFDNCLQSRYYDRVMEFWKQLLVATYPDKTPRPEPRQWLQYFRRLFDITDDHGGLAAVFRHAGIGDPRSVVYSPASELCPAHAAGGAHSPACTRFYSAVRLPTGSTASFRDIVFTKSVHNVCATWNALFAGLSQTPPIADLIKNWDLDTGVVQGGSNPPTYWG